MSDDLIETGITHHRTKLEAARDRLEGVNHTFNSLIDVLPTDSGTQNIVSGVVAELDLLAEELAG